jgi:8-oxo-dGTP pyrophosphatase MutT (NUDIX family)
MQMYKVFINEKKILLSKSPQSIEKKIIYEGTVSIEIALDLLQNTSCQEINIYGNDLEEIWEDFTHFFKIVEAAGGIVYNENHEILFIKRLGKWDLPKGKVEKGESMDQAALREVEEETGLGELILDKFINNTFHIYIERNGEKVLKTTYWYKMYYFGIGEAIPQIEEGITEVVWKDRPEIERDVLPLTFRNIQLILQEVEELN